MADDSFKYRLLSQEKQQESIKAIIADRSALVSLQKKQANRDNHSNIVLGSLKASPFKLPSLSSQNGTIVKDKPSSMATTPYVRNVGLLSQRSGGDTEEYDLKHEQPSPSNHLAIGQKGGKRVMPHKPNNLVIGQGLQDNLFSNSPVSNKFSSTFAATATSFNDKSRFTSTMIALSPRPLQSDAIFSPNRSRAQNFSFYSKDPATNFE